MKLKYLKETQQEKVYRLLREAGDTGVRSYDLTYRYNCKQAPARIWELINYKALPIDRLWDKNHNKYYVLRDQI